MDTISKKRIRLITFFILWFGLLLLIQYSYITTKSKPLLMIGGLITILILTYLLKLKQKNAGEYYRFKVGRNNVFKYPEAREDKIINDLTSQNIFKDKLNSKFQFISNIIMILTGISIIVLIFIFLDEYLYYSIVSFALIFLGTRNIIKNSKHTFNKTKLIIGKEGVWTERLGLLSWNSIKEINMLLSYSGTRNNEERVTIEITKYDNEKDCISLYEIGADKYKMRKIIKTLRTTSGSNYLG